MEVSRAWAVRGGGSGAGRAEPPRPAALDSRTWSQRQQGATKGCRQHPHGVKPSLEKGAARGGGRGARTGQAQRRPR